MTFPFRKFARCQAERGQVSAMLVILLPVLIGLAGLVVDGGIMFVHFRLGRVTMDSAAIAAATALNEQAFEDSNVVELQADTAYATAMAYAAENGRGRVAITGVSVSGPQITVSGAVTSPTLFMRIVGVNDVVFSLAASAELKYGITEEGQ